MNLIVKLLLALTLIVESLSAFALAPLGCLIEPSQIAQVGSQVVGVTESVNVERGDTVRKGQILATLKSDYEKANVDIANTRSQLEADVRSAEANLDLARITEKRGVDLVQKKFLSQQALDKSHAETVLAEQRLAFAKEQLRISGGELNVARAQLGLRSIRAPFDGIVAERFVWAGERVEDKPLFKIVKINPLRVEIVAPVELYGQIEKSQIIQIKPDLANMGSVDAKVVLVDKVIDGASNTFRIRAEIDNQTAEIPSGLRCKATIEPNSTAKMPDKQPKVSDTPVALTPKTNNKHSFELKPLAGEVKPQPQSFVTGQTTSSDQELVSKQGSSSNQALSSNQGFSSKKNLASNPSILALPNSDSSQQQDAAKPQFTLRTDNSVPVSSASISSNTISRSAPNVKVSGDKGVESNSTTLSIEEQYKLLQQQREALENRSYKPTSIKLGNITPKNNVVSKPTMVVAYHPTTDLNPEDKVGVAYPSALAPKSMRQVTPMPAGLRRITYRDARKTFPIRRVVALSPNAFVHEGASSTYSTVKVDADWQSSIVAKDDSSLKPKLKMDKALFSYRSSVNLASFQSN